MFADLEDLAKWCEAFSEIGPKCNIAKLGQVASTGITFDCLSFSAVPQFRPFTEILIGEVNLSSQTNTEQTPC